MDWVTDLDQRWAQVPRDRRAYELRTALERVAGEAEVRPLRSIYRRESNGNYMVEHRLSADASGAAQAWDRLRGTTYKDNPFRGDRSLWTVGRGAWGMMTPYYVARWDPNANPRILHHPYTSSVVALRTVRAFMDSGARTWTEVNEGWSSGRPRNESNNAMARANRFRARLERDGWGWLADQRPNPEASGWLERSDQDARLEALARTHPWGETPPDPPAPPPSSKRAAGVLLGSFLIYHLATGRKS